MKRTAQRRTGAALATIGVALLCTAAIGCDTARGHEAAADAADAQSPQAQGLDPSCTICHGDSQSAAPPRAISGETATTARGVGAHRAHLVGNERHGPVPCAACHIVPKGIYDPGHLDSKDGHATVTFSGVALAHGLTPTWDTETLSCANSGCHGAAMKAPGKHSKPIWNVVDGSQRGCDACHGDPPPAPHPDSKLCGLCHAETVSDGHHIIAPELHVNGKVDLKIDPKAACDACHGAPPTEKKHPKMARCKICHPDSLDLNDDAAKTGLHMNGVVNTKLPTKCDACHGADGSAAPPPDHNGESDPSLPTVGAHQAHLNGGTFSAGGMACSSCHTMFKAVDAPGHLDGSANTVNFPEGLAAKIGKPSYDTSKLSCSTVYCHGSTLDGAKVPEPVWNMDKLKCGACHGLPPGGNHPKIGGDDPTTKCYMCHSKTVDKTGTIKVKDGFHINGKVDL